jgi:hypothetical protein
MIVDVIANGAQFAAAIGRGKEERGASKRGCRTRLPAPRHSPAAHMLQ